MSDERKMWVLSGWLMVGNCMMGVLLDVPNWWKWLTVAWIVFCLPGWWRRGSALVLALFLVLPTGPLWASVPSPSETNKTSPLPPLREGSTFVPVSVWRDPHYGCEYIVFMGPSGHLTVAPRMIPVKGGIGTRHSCVAPR